MTLTVSGYGRRGKFCFASIGGVPCREEATYWVKLTMAPIETRVCIDCAARMRKQYPDDVESMRTYRRERESRGRKPAWHDPVTSQEQADIPKGSQP